jgi:hypothetical protein
MSAYPIIARESKSKSSRHQSVAKPNANSAVKSNRCASGLGRPSGVLLSPKSERSQQEDEPLITGVSADTQCLIQHLTGGSKLNSYRTDQISGFIIDTRNNYRQNVEIVREIKEMMQLQTQQIMHLMEIQIKYGLTNVMPEDEMCDFNIESNLDIQHKLDCLLTTMETHDAKIPESVQKLQTELLVVDKGKFNSM